MPAPISPLPAIALLITALSLAGCIKTRPLAEKNATPPATNTPAAAPSAPSAPASPPPVATIPLPASFPAFNGLWTEKEMQSAALLLEAAVAQDRRSLPTSATQEGVAFFGALRRAAAESYRLPSPAKVALGNSYIRFLPLYVEAARRGQRLDREIALLVALEFELADHFVQDRSFTAQDPGANAFNPKGGNVLVFFEEGRDRLDTQIRERLILLREEQIFRPESRALALSYASRHLPTIARVLKLQDLRPLLTENARLESIESNRAYYQAILGSVWIN